MKKTIIIVPIILLVLSCSDIKSNNTANKDALVSQVTYQDQIHSKVYFESEAYKMILFAMKKEQTLKPHSAPMDTPLLLLEGEANITIDQKTHTLGTGESIILPKNLNHAVYPISDIKFVLIK